MSEIWSKKYIGLHVKIQLFLSDFNEILIFPCKFSKNPQISNFMKFRLVEAELFHADGRPDMTKLLVAFRNFANAPKLHNKTLLSLYFRWMFLQWSLGEALDGRDG
jgi:hypothetical protein